MGQIAVVDDGSGGFPVEAETVVADADIVGRLVDRGRFVDHDGVRLEAEESVGQALGNVENVAVGGTEFHGGGLSVSGRVPPQIQKHIFGAAADAIDQLRVIVGGELEMHPAEDALVGGGEKLLHRLKLNPKVTIESLVHGFDEVAAMVQEDAGGQKKGSGEWMVCDGKHSG